MPEPAVDWDALEDLARRAVAGEAAARHSLVWALWPEWERLLRASSAMGRYGRSDDHVRTVAMRLVEKVGAVKNLSSYLSWRERNEGRGFADWIRIVTTNAARDHIRQTVREPSERASDLDRTALMNDFASSPVPEGLRVRPPITAAQTARQLLEFAESHLDRAHMDALERWVEGCDFDDIARELGLASADDARKRVRAAVATLRRAFAP
jgi:DNA-directed RNA polymerase specialized sigma24 family protein